MSKSTILTDPDGVILDVAPAHRGSRYAEDAVAIRTGGGRIAWVSAAELIAAIEKAAGIEKLTVTQAPTIDDGSRWWKSGAEPETLWTEVRERPARAVKVTPELVRTLAGTREHTELRELEPVFDRSTGEPFGVTWYDFRRMVDVTAEANGNTYVILRQRQVPEMLGEKEFELMYEEVA